MKFRVALITKEGKIYSKNLSTKKGAEDFILSVANVKRAIVYDRIEKKIIEVVKF